MEKSKQILNWGWVTAEKQMIRKFEKCAREGWIPDPEAHAVYKIRMKQAAPQDLQYAIDWQPTLENDAEYLSFFEAAGWKLALKEKGGFYIFSAPEGVPKPHTDRALLRELRKGRLKKFIPATLIYLLICIVFLVSVRVVAMPTWVVFLLCIPAAYCAFQFGILLVSTISLLVQQNDF